MVVLYRLILLLFFFWTVNCTFICDDGTEIKVNEICDGTIHCPDGSDETRTLCSHVICPPHTLRCSYGACIYKQTRCNGIPECYDGSDEIHCGKIFGSCEKTQFKCNSSECIPLDQVCDGTKNCECGSDETEDLCQQYVCPDDAFHCKYGGCVHKDTLCNGFVDCPDGSDENESMCQSFKCKDEKCKTALKCPPIISNRLSVICESTNGILPCDAPVPVGTVAKYECKEYYVPVDDNNNNQAHCQEDGVWNRDILKCKPECGKRDPNIQPLIVNGWQTNNIWPWHVVLYSYEGSNWAFSCGGTLISEYVVLTAAHCTWKKSKQNLQIAVGKYYSDFNVKQDYTRYRNLSKIIMQPHYRDFQTNFGSDLSVLILEEPILFSDYVRPICIDWDLSNIKEHLSNDTLGTIVGMGVTENDTFSETLRGIQIPVVSTEQCLKKQSRDFKKYISFTAFCAGWSNGTGVCNGDSGGGMVFRSTINPNQWILQGIVSISPRRKGIALCDPHYYTVFTKLGLYLDWLKDTLLPEQLGT